jgi:hypothetical protein
VRLLEEFTERDLARLAGMVVAAAEGFVAVSDRRPPDEPMLAFNGLPMTVPVMTAAMLGEQLIHGLDIARAVGVDWPISRTKALQVIAGVMAMVPDYVDRQKAAGLHAAYELRFRGGPRYRLTIDDGTAAVGPATGQADCWISADPVAYLLVGYGRNARSGVRCYGGRSSPGAASPGSDSSSADSSPARRHGQLSWQPHCSSIWRTSDPDPATTVRRARLRGP